jgi:hypothetical protein
MADLSRTIVSIRFSGQDLDPKKLGEMLGFVESESSESTIKHLKSGVVVWSINFRINETLPLEKKIEALLTRFTNEINAWEKATKDVKADIFCGLFLDGWNEGFSLSSNILKEISDRNIRIGFDIYSPTDSWDI